MHPLSAHSKSNINPVVDDQGHTVGLSNPVKLSGSFDLSPCVALFVPILDDRYTCIAKRQ